MTNSTVSDVDAGFAHLDLTGKLIIKAQLKNDIRKIPIHNDDLTYNELVLMLQRLFKGKFDAKDDILLKYKDEDGDLVTIADDSDLKFAIQCNRILKLNVYLNGESARFEHEDIGLFKTGLERLMEKANNLLEKIENKLHVDNYINENAIYTRKLETVPEISNSGDNLILKESKEFDPLNASKDLNLEKRDSDVNLKENENDSLKNLESSHLNDSLRNPATIQPSVQQCQTPQDLQSKIINQSNQFQVSQNFSNENRQQPTQPAYRYGLPPSNSRPNEQSNLSTGPPVSLLAGSQSNASSAALSGPPLGPSSGPPLGPSSGPPLGPSSGPLSGPPLGPPSGPPGPYSQLNPASYQLHSSFPGSHPHPPPSLQSSPFGAYLQNQQNLTGPPGPPQSNLAEHRSGPSSGLPNLLPGSSAPSYLVPSASNSYTNSPPTSSGPQLTNPTGSQLSNPSTSLPNFPPTSGPPQNIGPNFNPNQSRSGNLQGPPQFSNFPPPGPPPTGSFQAQGPQSSKSSVIGTRGPRGYGYPQYQ